MLENFFFLTGDVPAAVGGSYIPYLIFLSYIVATFGSYVGLTIAHDLARTEGRGPRIFRHLAGAFALASGIWSMHFIGMLAYKLEIPVYFEPALTLLSMVIALCIAIAVLFVAYVQTWKFRHLVAASVLLGLAICSMHYVGMAAMRMDARILYSPQYFTLSVLIAILSSSAALSILFYLGRARVSAPAVSARILSALILGLGVCGMHYMGMAAANFMPYGGVCRPGDAPRAPMIDADIIGIIVTLVTGAILVMALAVTIHNRERNALRNTQKGDVFPIRLIGLCVALTFLTVSILGGLSLFVASEMDRMSSRDEKIRSLTIRYMDIDKKMANSLALFTMTRDEKWGSAYLTQTYEQQRLSRGLKSGLRTDDPVLRSFDEAGDQRDRQDRHILSLAGSGDSKSAGAFLKGREYQQARTDYERSLNRFLHATAKTAKDRMRTLIRMDFILLFVSVMAAIALGIVWYFTYRGVRRWQKEIIEGRNRLAERFAEKEALEKRIWSYLSETKIARDEAVKSMHRADEANKAKTDFLTNMSHELRTPMNSILGLTEILIKNEQTSPEHRELLSVILEAGETLLKIVNDILDIAKIEAQGITLEKNPFRLDAMMANVLNTLRPMAIEKGLSFEHDMLGADCILMADEVRLARVFTNVLGNAIKYTETGSVFLKLNIRDTKPGEVLLSAEVADTGIGIAADKQESVFEKFSQADNSITRRFGGTGLGLAITRELVELMGGRIGVESRIDEGSRFFLEIPLEKGRHPSVSTEDTSETGPVGSAGIPIARARILIAEDHALNQIYMQTLFREMGFNTVFLARDGLEVLSILEQEKIDLILMDCNMPEMNGFEATGRIRAAEKAAGGHVPIIAMTARAMVGDRETCVDAGMDDYVSKPIDTESLRAVLSRWIQFKETRH